MGKDGKMMPTFRLSGPGSNWLITKESGLWAWDGITLTFIVFFQISIATFEGHCQTRIEDVADFSTPSPPHPHSPFNSTFIRPLLRRRKPLLSRNPAGRSRERCSLAPRGVWNKAQSPTVFAHSNANPESTGNI